MKQLIVLINNQKLVLVLIKRMKMRRKRMNLLPLLWLVSLNDQQLRGTQCICTYILKQICNISLLKAVHTQTHTE